MLEELARQQQIVLRLMSALGEQLNSLISVRDESRSLIDQLASRERRPSCSWVRTTRSLATWLARAWQKHSN